MRYPRTGKLARFPKQLRDEVSQMIHDRVPYRDIIEKLGAHGAGLTIYSISNWKRRGHREWLAEQQRLADQRNKWQFALDRAQAVGASKFYEASLHLAAAQLHDLLKELDLTPLKERLRKKPGEYHTIVKTLTRISKAILNFEKYRDHVQQQKCILEGELARAPADGCISPETIAKMREALNQM